MTKAGKFLKFFEEDPLAAEPGIRITDGYMATWYLCKNCEARRVHDGWLKTNSGLVNANAVEPVDNGAHNCTFCGVKLSPEQPPMPMPSPEDSEMQSDEPVMAGVGESTVFDQYRCTNRTCKKYNKNQGKKAVCMCGHKLSWKQRKTV